MKSLGLMLLLALTLGAVDPTRFEPVARQLIAAINAGDVEAVEALFDAPMRAALPAEKVKPFITGLVAQRGKLKEIHNAQLEGATATYDISAERGNWQMVITLDDDGLLSGLLIRQPKPTAPVPERNSVPMRLPFEGEWTIFWGGADPAQNAHAAVPNQRRALDIVMTDDEGGTHKGRADVNESYYCYGKEVLAPADAKVITVIDGVPDNKPGSMNPFSALGNCIILQLSPNEFAVLAHLIPGSPTVKVGQTVNAGTLLGKCGNSGNSSESHLHFHLQNTAVIQDGLGIAPYFKNIRVERDGKSTDEADYSPVKGDHVQQK